MSSIELIRTYFAERYRATFFVPLAILLYGAGLVALGSPTTVIRSFAGIVVAYALVLSCRVRDDVADVAVDRARHPERVTVVATDLTPIRTMANGSLLLAGALVALSSRRTEGLVVLVVLLVLLDAWYTFRGTLRPSGLQNAMVVLLKYPAIAFVAATAGTTARHDPLSSSGLSAGFIAIYLAACMYEVLHDRGMQT